MENKTAQYEQITCGCATIFIDGEGNVVNMPRSKTAQSIKALFAKVFSPFGTKASVSKTRMAA